MIRDRAWRRHKNFTKAINKQNKDKIAYWHPYLWYNNLHQYSKNKIHCSCPMCRTKTKNHGAAAYYNGSYNPSLHDRKMDESIKYNLKESLMVYVRFYGHAGVLGTEYEEYGSFDDNVTEDYLNYLSEEYATDNFDEFGGSYDSDEEYEEDLESVLEWCGWEYISEEEYEKC